MEGDLHDIGKNLVAMMWKGANIEVIDLGVNVSPAAFVSAVETHRPQIVGMSALLTTTMPRMRNAVAAVKASGIPTKVVIGGAPVSRGVRRGGGGRRLRAGRRHGRGHRARAPRRRPFEPGVTTP